MNLRSLSRTGVRSARLNAREIINPTSDCLPVKQSPSAAVESAISVEQRGPSHAGRTNSTTSALMIHLHKISLPLFLVGISAAANAQSVLLSPAGSQKIIQPSGTGLYANVFEQTRYADQFPGATVCQQINNAIRDLPAAGGTVDARGLGPTANCSNPDKSATNAGVNLSKPVRLLLGATTFSWSFAGPLFTITASGCSIEGIGRMGSTVLQPPGGSTAIYAAQGLESTAIRHLSITGQNGSSPSLFAIQIDAATPTPTSPANNSTFFIEDVYVYGGLSGIQAIRPINSTLKDVRVSATISDGFSFIGDGTTVTCINCYANANGANGFHVSGIANATFIGGEADVNGGDGVLAEMSSSEFSTTGLTLSGLDIEANHGNGIHLINAGGTSIAGSVIINNLADGIQMCGGVGLTMSGGRIAANGSGTNGYGVNLAPSSGCPYTGSSAAANVTIISPLIDAPNAHANIYNSNPNIHDPNPNIYDPNHVAFSYLPPYLSPHSNSATVSLGGALWGVGSGTPTASCTTGSMYTDLNGAPGATLYVCEANAWTRK